MFYIEHLQLILYGKFNTWIVFYVRKFSWTKQHKFLFLNGLLNTLTICFFHGVKNDFLWKLEKVCGTKRLLTKSIPGVCFLKLQCTQNLPKSTQNLFSPILDWSLSEYEMPFKGRWILYEVKNKLQVSLDIKKETPKQCFSYM